ncbi:MAG: ATP-binding protein [Firmicutes bacterium]|nr:ATP-binding protein [Bacillota bacterium]
MKELLILSGKGGTGKTTIAGAFVKLSSVRAYADCDVDAPNLHLIFGCGDTPKSTNYYGLPKANINADLCIKCDKCRGNCQFGAITFSDVYKVNHFACEGCSVCHLVCPVNAVSMIPAVSGELMLYENEQRVFSTAQLKMGSGTSGMLVTKVKRQMKDAASGADLAIIDGSPGIGCPVIASISGVDLVLVVAEPSLSGISDMERIIATAQKFGTPTAVCVNKYDTCLGNTKKIEEICKNRGLPFVGKIPFDPQAVIAVNNGQAITDVDCKSGLAVKGVYKNAMKLLHNVANGKQ